MATKKAEATQTMAEANNKVNATGARASMARAKKKVKRAKGRATAKAKPDPGQQLDVDNCVQHNFLKSRAKGRATARSKLSEVLSPKVDELQATRGRKKAKPKQRVKRAIKQKQR